MMIYDNDLDYRDEIRDFWNRNVKKFRVASIITGIVMVALGVVGIIWPLQSAVFVGYLMAAAMVALGIVRCVGYFRVPSYFRSGLGLIGAILDIILGVLLMFSGTDTILYTLSFMFAIELTATGIESIMTGDRLRFFGFKKTGFTVSGVINLIVGTLLFFMPGASIMTMAAIAVFFLMTKGILLIVDGIRAGHLKAGE
ncbi:MAG: HdeD family acid-resistance protein [Anaerovoracaceae bacterium]